MERDDTDVLALIDNTKLLRTRSSLRDWMRTNHDAFKQRMGGRIADWEVLAGFFAKAGLTDRLGKPPKAETARKMWQRVRREIEAGRAAKPPPPQPVDPPPPMRQSAPEQMVQRIEPNIPPPQQEDEAEDRIIEPGSKFGGRPAVSKFKPKGST